MSIRHVIVAGLVVAGLGCSRTIIIFESEFGRCEVHDEFSYEEVMDACGIPDGLRWRPKVVGSWFTAEMCSAPAFLYGPTAIAFGCDGHPAELLVSSDGGLLQEGLDDVLRGVSGRLAVAQLGELRHRTHSADERHRVLAVADTAARSDDPTVRRAAQNLIDALSKTP